MKLLNWGVYLIVFCLPLYLVRFEIFGIPTAILEILIYVLFVFWLITRLRVTGYGLRITKLSIPIILIVIGVTLATIFSSDLRVSAGIWKAWFVDPILFFIILISVIKNSEQVKKVLFSLFLSGTTVSIIALVYLILGKLDPLGRLQAFYNSPNYLAMYLAPALIIGLFSKKIYFFILALLVATALFFTYSYGAWLGILVAIGFYCLRLRLKYKAVVLGIVLAGILVLGICAMTQRPSSFDVRLIIWQKALQIYKTSPILGIGPGTFGDYFLSFPEWGVPQPHNLFLAFLLQTGIIGFIGFIWLLIYFYKKRTSIVLTMVMTYILVHGLVDTTYWKNDLAVVFWLIIALCYTTSHHVYSQKRDNLLKEKETAQ